MIIRTPADYRVMPWANGRGQTTELLREDGPEGLRLRLSIAVVAEDGPFSVLPGIDRNLTVIAGPGFWLRGPGVALQAAPLVPVAFAGDLAVTATDVAGVSEDFNVMTARGGAAPQVWLPQPGIVRAGGRLFLLALTASVVDGHAVADRSLCETMDDVTLTCGTVIAVRVT